MGHTHSPSSTASHVPPPAPPSPAHSGIETTYCLSTIGVKDFLPSHRRLPGPTELQGGNLNSASALRCLFFFSFFLSYIMSDCQAGWINNRQITCCDVSALAASNTFGSAMNELLYTKYNCELQLIVFQAVTLFLDVLQSGGGAWGTSTAKAEQSD